MKAVLKFDLSDPDEAMEHMRCVKSFNMAVLLWNLRHNLSRYLDQKVNDKSMKAFSEMLRSAMDQEGILIDELIN